MDRERNWRERRVAADYLTKKGYRVTSNTLEKLACIGGGPKFHKFGRRVLYDQPDLDAWAQARLSRAMSSTSEAA